MSELMLCGPVAAKERHHTVMKGRDASARDVEIQAIPAGATQHSQQSFVNLGPSCWPRSRAEIMQDGGSLMGLVEGVAPENPEGMLRQVTRLQDELEKTRGQAAARLILVRSLCSTCRCRPKAKLKSWKVHLSSCTECG